MKKGLTYDELAAETGVGRRMLQKRVRRDGVETLTGDRERGGSVQKVTIVPMDYCRKLIRFYSRARQLAVGNGKS